MFSALFFLQKCAYFHENNCAIRFSHNFSHFSVNLNSNWCCDLFIIIAIIHSKHAISLCRYNSVPPPLSISSRTPPTLILPISSRTCMNFSRVVCNAFMLRLLVFRLMMSESFYTDIEQTTHYRKLQ